MGLSGEACNQELMSSDASQEGCQLDFQGSTFSCGHYVTNLFTKNGADLRLRAQAKTAITPTIARQHRPGTPVAVPKLSKSSD
jgi:hypothetical protein